MLSPKMAEPTKSMAFLFVTMVPATILFLVGSLDSVSAVCELSFVDGNKLYNYSLVSPIPNFPHGILSEDGFYKVVENDTVLRFQLCSGMLFNHDLPKCVDCEDCGLSSFCQIGCSGLATENIGGWDVCTPLGDVSSTATYVKDNRHPHQGVMVNMSAVGSKRSCSLSVSVICDPNDVQGPYSLKKSGVCDYATVLHHPSGCATIMSAPGRGLGWFGTLIVIALCLFGSYIVAGVTYRHFFLGIRGIDILPNLEFWAGLPHKMKYRDLKDQLKVTEAPTLESAFEDMNMILDTAATSSGFSEASYRSLMGYADSMTQVDIVVEDLKILEGLISMKLIPTEEPH